MNRAEYPRFQPRPDIRAMEAFYRENLPSIRWLCEPVLDLVEVQLKLRQYLETLADDGQNADEILRHAVAFVGADAVLVFQALRSPHPGDRS